MLRSARVSLASILVVAAPAVAMAADRKVPSEAYPTIQAAVSAAQSGDRILVGKGTYAEHVEITQNDLQIIGKKAVWDGHVGTNGGVCLTVSGANVTVSGFKFVNGIGHVRFSAAGGKILKCASRGAGGDAFRFQDASGCRIEKSTVVNSFDDGIEWSNCPGFTCLGNTVRNAGGRSIGFEESSDSLIERNVVTNGGDVGIEGDGDRVEIRDNRVDTTASEGIDASGTDMRIQFNTVRGSGDTGIDVNGAGAIVEGNTVQFVGTGAPGIAYSGGGQRTFIDDNTVGDVVGIGIQVSSSGVSVDDNFVYRSGSYGGPSILVSGNNNTMEDNSVSDAMGSGLTLDGNGNTCFQFVVKDSAQDGVVVIGDGNFMDEIQATLCDGEGFENRGTNTTLEDSFFAKNRLDLARSVDGTWAVQPFEDVTFRTGGPDRLAEVDKFIR